MRQKMHILAALLALLLCGCTAAPAQTLPQETAAPIVTTAPVETTAPTTVPQETEAEKVMAPDFTVYDADGNPVKLSDFRGKPVVLNFWASWCGPCKQEMPDFNEVYLARGEELQFLMVNLTDGKMETLESAKSFIASSGYSFPVYFDTSYEAASLYGVSSIPATYMISADGELVAYAVGALDMETLLTGISMID